MSLDKRDYMYDPKQFRNGNIPRQKYPKFQIEYESELKKRKAARELKLLQSLMLLVISATAVWLFRLRIVNFWENTALPQINVLSEQISSHSQQIVPASLNIPPFAAFSELQFPKSGSIIQYQQPSGLTGVFTVVQAGTENCVIKLDTWDTGIPVIELFVRAGERAETRAPLGIYRVKYTCGIHWYGRSELFGRGTPITIGESPVQLWQSDNATQGFTLSLTKSVDGNFKTSDSRLNKF